MFSLVPNNPRASSIRLILRFCKDVDGVVKLSLLEGVILFEDCLLNLSHQFFTLTQLDS